jgi:Uri superfamily endonuclease
VYIGSAFGPGGVQARVAHHCQPPRRPHWHIDYVKSALQLEEIWWTHDPVRREHQWAATVQRMHGASIPLQGFGASDCACDAHLYFLARPPSFSAFCRRLQREAREVSLDKTVTLKAPLRLLWRHSPVFKLAVCRNSSGKFR